MRNLVEKFKEHVIEECKNSEFIHKDWFVKYHLEIVEKISLELCEKYSGADKNLVLLLVWLHDYGKIVNIDKQDESTREKGKAKLKELGFSEEISEKSVSYIERLDAKENLSSKETPIEIKIVSSADGASHLVGPFFYLWWHDNPDKDFETLMREDKEKASIDWNEKIVLPEVKEAFKERYEFFLEQNGEIPGRYLG